MRDKWLLPFGILEVWVNMIKVFLSDLKQHDFSLHWLNGVSGARTFFLF